MIIDGNNKVICQIASLLLLTNVPNAYTFEEGGPDWKLIHRNRTNH